MSNPMKSLLPLAVGLALGTWYARRTEQPASPAWGRLPAQATSAGKWPS